MIIKTKIEWSEPIEISEEEKAKREVLGSEYQPIDDYEKLEKEAIIDTVENKLYVEIDERKVCLTELLGADYLYSDSGFITKMEEKIYLITTLDKIYKMLTKKEKIN